MGYLEWRNEIRIVSISGQKLAEVMFYWSKFGGIHKLIKKSQNYDTFFVRFETTPWTVLGPNIHWTSNYGTGIVFIMPRHQKVAGYYVIPSEILSVRPPVCLSVRPSVRPSAPTTILVSATPPTVLGQSFWNFTGVLRMVWRYAYCFFRILKLFFITFFPFLT